MNSPLKLWFLEETVTFSRDSDYPEISGYGDKIPIEVYSTDPQDPLNSVVIKIGDNMFLPSQIKNILDQHAAFLRAVNAFSNKEKN